MGLPESEKLESRSMGEERQPSVVRHEEDDEESGEEVGSQADLQAVRIPHEMDSTGSACGSVGSIINGDPKLIKASEISGNGISDAGPFSPKAGSAEEVGMSLDHEDSEHHLDAGSSGADGGARSEENLKKEGDPREEEDDSFVVGTAQAADSTVGVQYLSATFGLPTPVPPLVKSSDAHLVDIPVITSVKVEELDSYKRFTLHRTLSNFSAESGLGDQCRICQQHTEEQLMELGCQCRGELARAHRTCVDHWFGNKGTNKCEVCQYVATNVPLPASQPTPHFWVWRVGGPYNSTSRHGGGVGIYRLNPLPMRPVLLMTLRRHPTILLLWLLLFAFMAYLFVDVTDSTSIGYAAMPIGFLFGVLVVLGLGTAARLVLECWHERVIRRNIRRMEEEPNFDDLPPEQTDTTIQVDPVEGQASVDQIQDSPGAPPPPQGTDVRGAAEASVAATTTPDVVNR